MKTIIPRYSAISLLLAILIFPLHLVLSTRLMSESILETSPEEAPDVDFITPTQRLMEKLDELDEKHIRKEKVISELKSLLIPGGYGALDFESDDVVARLYLIATVHPKIMGDVLSYHKSAVSQSYLKCLRTVESTIKLNLGNMETAGSAQGLFRGLVNRVQRLERLLFVSSLEQHARQGIKWKETYYGNIESKLAMQRQELEKTFESTRGADFESSFATMIILNWPAWSSTLTCGKTHPSLEQSAPQPEQNPSFTSTPPSVVPNTEPNGNVSSPVVEPQPTEKKVPTPNVPKKPQRKVPSEEWIEIR